jgi:hypothetical protein
VPLDVNTARFDVAECIRVARDTPSRGARWNDMRVVLAIGRDALVLDGRLALAITRVLVRVPSGAVVPGPVLAWCPRSCGRRARVLWTHPFDRNLFLSCRTCALGRYATAATSSEVDRAGIAYERLRARLGLTRPWQTFERKPRQRRTTHARLVERLDQARRRWEAALTG